MGITLEKAIATSIDINPQMLIDVPANWSLEDGACCINSLFLVWYSLIDRAQLEEGLNPNNKFVHSNADFDRRNHFDSSWDQSKWANCNSSLSTNELQHFCDSLFR